jgi:hypothetical protein
MEQNKKLKLFIIYSHLDESYIEQFKKHIAPLKDNGLIEEWYDRKILPGEDYQNRIDNNLEDADIICLFISANFLDSPSCKKEKKKALELRKKKVISVIPIILSPCGWLDDKDISKPLALPTDGKPVSSFQNMDEAWLDVYNGLKKIVEKEIKIRQIKIKHEFESYLQDTEMLAKAHSQKERILLDDIFTYPELDKYDDLRAYEEKISSEELLNNLLEHPKIVIAGEALSGKTTLCKMIFKELRKKNFVPVYISDKANQFRGRIENIILRSFQKEYEGADINEIDKERIIPIIDDFHFAKNKEKHIENLSKYSYCIAVVDDIFCLNIKDEELIKSFDCFKIRELKPSVRYELIKKWKFLTDKETIDNADNNLYKEMDKTTELIDSTLGKTIGKGIMPSYPFYILSALVTYETFSIPLNQEITSQGYCYQALIYFYLRKQGAKDDEIDIYINFLTEIAFYFFREKKYELSHDDFTLFMKRYLEKYNLPIKQETLLKNLSQIILVDSFNNYSFRYPYLYYFFVAKYLAEYIEESEMKRIIEKIMQNLHVDENACIAIFIAHHSKNIQILDEIELNALILFDKYKPATLIKEEVKFFDERADIIIKAVLPPANTTAEKERAEMLKVQDEREQSQEDLEPKDEPLEIDLRRAIKTVEVMGSIIKNRAGSLEKTKLEEIFEEAMNVHLRILSSFFKLIESKENQKDIVNFISERLEKINKEKEGKLKTEKLEQISRTIFWNLNFFVVYGVIYKIVHSLGSDKLIEIVNKVCNDINTPASFIVKHGILMWYNKNLQIEGIAKKFNEKDFSGIAKRVMRFMVVNHCALHQINYENRQRVENKLGIPAEKLSIRP